ncbi:hypothetical protein C8R45DRAFT_1214817 [Mycena sanguinolenta]|nr:hypothetical protein C8R45DRAFT_1214817 [Mycena sanguinolenta]
MLSALEISIGNEPTLRGLLYSIARSLSNVAVSTFACWSTRHRPGVCISIHQTGTRSMTSRNTGRAVIPSTGDVDLDVHPETLTALQRRSSSPSCPLSRRFSYLAGPPHLLPLLAPVPQLALSRRTQVLTHERLPCPGVSPPQQPPIVLPGDCHSTCSPSILDRAPAAVDARSALPCTILIFQRGSCTPRAESTIARASLAAVLLASVWRSPTATKAKHEHSPFLPRISINFRFHSSFFVDFNISPTSASAAAPTSPSIFSDNTHTSLHSFSSALPYVSALVQCGLAAAKVSRCRCTGGRRLSCTADYLSNAAFSSWTTVA